MERIVRTLGLHLELRFQAILLVSIFVALFLCHTLKAESFRLVFRGGMGEVQVGEQLDRPDLEIYVEQEGTQLRVNGWGYAPWFNLARHRVKAAAVPCGDGKCTLELEVQFESDRSIPGGSGRYRLELQRAASGWIGRYTGQVFAQEVAGEVTTLAGYSLPAVDKVAPLQAGEHPRLIYRPSFKPCLDERLKTDVGAAFSALVETAPVRDTRQVTDRHTAWIAAGHAARHVLLGDAQALEQARSILFEEVVRRPMPRDRSDVQRAPRLMGLALCYDLLYSSLQPELQPLLTQYLYECTLDLFHGWQEGLPFEDWNPYPWAHRNAMRMGAVGLAALALWQEPSLSADQAKDVRCWIDWASQDIATYLTEGVGNSGAGAEGDFYKKLALANGVLPFMHALRQAEGIDLGSLNPMLLCGALREAYLGDPAGFKVSVRAVQASGLWVMGLGCVAPPYLGTMKWAFDRECGLAGNQSFDCIYGFQGLYGLCNYPFEVQDAPPGGVLPWAMLDKQLGYFVFRPQWSSTQDLLVRCDFRSNQRQGMVALKEASGLSMHLRGLGEQWLSGPVGFKPKNHLLGAEILEANELRPRQVVIQARLDPLFRPQYLPPRQKGAKPTDAVQSQSLSLPVGVVRDRSLPGDFYPPAFTGTRQIGVDASGVSGVPLLLVLVDRYRGALQETWNMGIDGLRFENGRFVKQGADGATLSVVLLLPEKSRSLRCKGSETYYLVMTLSEGQAPLFEVNGSGLNTEVQVGQQRVRLEQERIVFEK